ncbi:MAG: YfhO family protein [Balneolaceae bacterium]
MSSKKKKKESIKPDFWEGLSPAKKHILCLGFLFILPFILFFESTLGGQQYIGHDVIQWRAGAQSLIEHREQNDEVAHWAANMFSGMPATTISMPPQAWNLDNTVLRFFNFIYPAIEYWILFGGSYLMFLLLGARPLTSVFGAVVIGFSAYIPIIIGAGHNAKFLAYIYMPWIYSGYFLITRTGFNRWLAFFLFALAVTLHLRAYHPQVTYFFLFPLGTLFIYDLFKAWKGQALKPFLNHTGLIVCAAVIALLVTIQLYWSTAEYSAYSTRGGSEIENIDGLSQDYAFAWSQGIGELLTLVIPGSFGGASGDAYWGPKSFTSGPHYMGALTILFLIIGLIKSRHKLKWIFFAPGAAALLFSLGENFLLLNRAMFNYFPLFDKFRAPEMWLMVTVFCFAVVAVMGFEWTLQKIKEKSPEWKKALAITGGAGVVFLIIGFQMLSFEKPGERMQIAQQIAQQNQVSPDDPRVTQAVNRYISNELIPAREELAYGDTLRFGILFALGLGIIWFAGNQKIPISTGSIAICLIIAFDMIQVDSRYLSENALADGSLTREQVIERQAQETDRFIEQNVPHPDGWPYRALPLLSNPFNNAIPAYFYPSAGGYSGAKLGYYQDLIDEAFFSGPIGLNTGVMNMLNIKYLTAQGPLELPGFEAALQTERGTVMENKNVLPKAWFVQSVETLPDQPAVLREISQDFDAATVAYTVQEPAINVQADTAGTVRVTHYSANNIRLELSRTNPGFLVLSEIWYPPGWTATLNGSEIEIIRTNYVLRGFEIPAGEHELVLTLDPVWYKTGNLLSIMGTFILFGIGLSGFFIYYRKSNV